MTLHLSFAFILIVTLLAVSVALNVRLVLGPLRFITLLAFLAFRTWLTISGIKLHLLQPVIVVVPFWNISFGLRVGRSVSSIETSSTFLHLSFVETFVDLHCDVVHFPRRCRTRVTSGNLILDLILQTTIEMRGDGLVIPVGLNNLGEELGLVL